MATAESFLDGKVTLIGGDCLDVLRTLADNSVDAVVTDPPYHLTANKKGGTGTASVNLDSPYGRSRIGTGNGSGGFMGKAWDGGDIAFRVELWAEVLRVLKPGGHCAAFSGTRTYHRMAVAIEDAGFEIRDQIGWAFGQGFPKSLDVGKKLDDWQGWGTALKPAWEPICLARKPLIGTVAENVLKHGTGALNIDGCRVATDETITATRNIALGLSASGVYGGADKPGIYEQHNKGRWPANVIHDGSDEVVGAFPDRDAGGDVPKRSGKSEAILGEFKGGGSYESRNDSGSAARFFYTAKADADDRLGSKHPTVKPLDLMQWLVRLVTPPGGVVLDPFAGTGTTGEAAFREGMRAVLIEREAEYRDDIRRRVKLYKSGLSERKRESVKAKTKDKPRDDGPLFKAAP